MGHGLIYPKSLKACRRRKVLVFDPLPVTLSVLLPIFFWLVVWHTSFALSDLKTIDIIDVLRRPGVRKKVLRRPGKMIGFWWFMVLFSTFLVVFRTFKKQKNISYFSATQFGALTLEKLCFWNCLETLWRLGSSYTNNNFTHRSILFAPFLLFDSCLFSLQIYGLLTNGISFFKPIEAVKNSTPAA